MNLDYPLPIENLTSCEVNRSIPDLAEKQQLCHTGRNLGSDVRYRISKTDLERIATVRSDYNSTSIQCVCRPSSRVRPAFEVASSAWLNSAEVTVRFNALFARALPHGWYWSIMLM